MSGGHFDYQQYHLNDIASTIEHDIARALRPKPEMVREDYWTIEEKDSPHSYHSYWGHHTFETYEEAESFLLSDKSIVKATSQYADNWHLSTSDDVLFQSTRLFMPETSDDKRIPILYLIHHCVYDHYPFDADVLELEDKTIETMKAAYRQIRIAEIYATRVDWMMSGDDGEDNLQVRLKEDLEAFDKEFQNKDWADLSIFED